MLYKIARVFTASYDHDWSDELEELSEPVTP